MKLKITAAVLSIFTLLSLCGCGSSKPAPSSEGDLGALPTAPAEPTESEDITSSPTEEPASSGGEYIPSAPSEDIGHAKALLLEPMDVHTEPVSFVSDELSLLAMDFRYTMLSEEERKLYHLLADGVRNHDEQIDVSSISLPMAATAIEDVWNCVVRTDEYCMVNGVYMMQISYEKFSLNVNYAVPTYPASKEEMDACYESVMSDVYDVVSEVSGMSQYDAVKHIHDYIVHSTDYKDGAYAHAAAGVFVDGNAVCEGYAKAFKVLCNRANIMSEVVFGKSGTFELMDLLTPDDNHMWNIVQIDGDWYEMDVTFDDPVGSNSLYDTYTFFNITSEDISLDHYRADVLTLPIGTSVEYNYFQKEGLVVGSEQELRSILPSVIKNTIDNRSHSISFKVPSKSVYDILVAAIANGPTDGTSISDYIYEILKDCGRDEDSLLFTSDDNRWIIGFTFVPPTN